MTDSWSFVKDAKKIRRDKNVKQEQRERERKRDVTKQHVLKRKKFQDYCICTHVRALFIGQHLFAFIRQFDFVVQSPFANISCLATILESRYVDSLTVLTRLPAATRTIAIASFPEQLRTREKKRKIMLQSRSRFIYHGARRQISNIHKYSRKILLSNRIIITSQILNYYVHYGIF